MMDNKYFQAEAILLLLMHTAGEDVSINDYLTTYLKQFKNSFHSQLTMIESISMDEQILQEKIQKVRESICGIDEQILSIQVMKQKINNKTLERFCLRINEYIEYRVNKAKGIIDQSITNELQAMCVALHRLFSQMGKERFNEQQQNLITIFMRISEIETKYIVRVLRKMSQTLQSKKKNEKGPQLLNSLIQYKLRKRFENSSPKYEQQKTVTTESSFTNHSRKSDFVEKVSPEHFISRLRTRKSLIQRIDHTSSVCTKDSDKFSTHELHEFSNINPSYSHLILKNPQDINGFDIDSEEVKSPCKFSRTTINFNKIQDIIQIDFSSINFRYTTQILMKQLIENNKKNSIMIDKFRKKANKKKHKLNGMILEDTKDTIESVEKVRHKRSATLDESSTRRSIKKPQKLIALPILRMKKIKI